MNDTTKNNPSTDNSIFIGEGVVFKGTITAPHQATVAGQFEGSLQAREITVNKTGVVSGTTTAQVIEVQGTLNEDVTSRGLLLVRSTGKVNGKVTYGEIEIERGGEVKGDMNQR
jgi:cytoskeletal protein CcmA (bactofilin family)